MISLRQITLDNRREMFNLKVRDDQKKYVASNLSSVASCYVLSINGSQPFPFAIYAGEQMIGFVMIVYGDTGYIQPKYAKDSYCLLRFMIDEAYQGKGYGREALSKIFDFIKTFPAGSAKYCWIPYSGDNKGAKKLYESFGFKDTGEVCNNELISRLEL
jgi:diamine N-acetyltransferase